MFVATGKGGGKVKKAGYFWTEQWQKWEREADKAYEAGKTIGPIKTRKELKAFLDSLKENTDDVEK
ncbi:hypothetical protein [Calditerricola satsumensis]|uniref:Uncharacterized protein n=1 Tax=Calditerricola satsumensis TaxID=373054 RepID=A0A8J3B7Y8_9BACI|nr:hypothetical protein [Calditerricola satsumensis]GGJ95955.1 hypothetical protein GCM10007043_07210 [Calditerricola satsumensis]